MADKQQDSFQITYQAAAAANVVISATPAFLHAIICGKAVPNGITEVSNHASDGDGNVQILIDTCTCPFTTIVDAFFDVGICVDMTLQTNVTFIWR
jgi:hypothetical protein